MIALSESLDIIPQCILIPGKKGGKMSSLGFFVRAIFGGKMKQQEKQSHGKIAIVTVKLFSAQGEVIFTKTITWRTRTCLLRRSRFCYYRPLFTQLFTSYAQREDPEIYCTPFFFFSNRTMVPYGSVVCGLSIPVLQNPILF